MGTVVRNSAKSVGERAVLQPSDEPLSANHCVDQLDQIKQSDPSQNLLSVIVDTPINRSLISDKHIVLGSTHLCSAPLQARACVPDMLACSLARRLGKQLWGQEFLEYGRHGCQ